MSFITDPEAKDHLAAVLSKDVSELVPQWDSHVRRANPAGYNAIVRALTVRGYTIAQIDAWDSGKEFQLDQGTFWALTYGAALHAYDQTFIKERDRRKELETVAVTIDGVLVDPAGTRGLRIGWGLQSQENEIFTQDIAGRDAPTEATKW